MALVKRDGSKDFVESYEINGFTVDLDTQTVDVRMTKYTKASSGIPIAKDLTYRIADHTKAGEPTVEMVDTPVVKRDQSGAIVMDSDGNPVTEIVQVPNKKTTTIQVNACSELIQTITSGGSLYSEIRDALYKSFIKYQLNDSIEYVVE